MSTVHISIGHHDDLVIARLFDVEALAGAGTHHLDDGRALLVGEHLRDRRLLHVQNLASNRQQCLETGVAGGLGGTECGITLDDEQFGHVVIARLAVGEFGRHRGGFERVLAARDLLGLARLDACVHFADDLLQHAAGLFLVPALGAGDHLAELLVGEPGDDRLDLRGAKHILGLALELRFGHACGDHGHESGLDIVALHLHGGVLHVHLELAGVVFHRLANLLGDGVHETVHVSTAAGRLHDVHEAHDCGVIAVDPSQGDIHAAGAFDFLGVQFTALAHGLGLLLIGALALDAPDVGDRLAFGQEVDEVLDAACVQEFHDARVRGLFAERAINDLVAGRQREVLLGRALGIVGRDIQGRCLVLRRFDCCVISGLDGVSRRRFRYVFVDDGDSEAGHQEAGLTHAVDELFV